MDENRADPNLFFDVDGKCMRPWLWPGMKLEVQRCGVAELRLGDVAVWFDGAALRSHRVVELRGAQFVTRGDLQLRPDPAAQPEQLVGRGVRAAYRGFSFSLDHAGARWLGRLSALAGPVAVALVRSRRETPEATTVADGR